MMNVNREASGVRRQTLATQKLPQTTHASRLTSHDNASRQRLSKKKYPLKKCL